MWTTLDLLLRNCVLSKVYINSQNTIRVLDDIFCTFRAPIRLLSDRGSCFASHDFKRFSLDKGVKNILNAVASPRSNGQVKRYNRTVLDSLKAVAIKYDENDCNISHLGKIQWRLKNTIQKTIGRTPSKVLFGIYMNGEINPILKEVTNERRENFDINTMRDEVNDRIDSDEGKQKQAYNKGRR